MAAFDAVRGGIGDVTLGQLPRQSIEVTGEPVIQRDLFNLVFPDFPLPRLPHDQIFLSVFTVHGRVTVGSGRHHPLFQPQIFV